MMSPSTSFRINEVEPLAGEESLYFKQLRPFTSFRVTQKNSFSTDSDVIIRLSQDPEFGLYGWQE
jgi:hypothetical protein